MCKSLPGSRSYTDWKDEAGVKNWILFCNLESYFLVPWNFVQGIFYALAEKIIHLSRHRLLSRFSVLALQEFVSTSYYLIFRIY